jgi:hypothetical protein
LECVAVALREKYPAATIIVCADDDWLTRVNGRSKNVGKIAGQKAAKDKGAALALPWFGPARPKWATDFNDQARLSGLDGVADGIRLALVSHEENLRLHAGEPPPATSDVTISEDALALRFAETNGDALRFVAVWPRWFEWTTNRWRADEKLHAMSLARATCREAAEGVK